MGATVSSFPKLRSLEGHIKMVAVFTCHLSYYFLVFELQLSFFLIEVFALQGSFLLLSEMENQYHVSQLQANHTCAPHSENKTVLLNHSSVLLPVEFSGPEVSLLLLKGRLAISRFTSTLY